MFVPRVLLGNVITIKQHAKSSNSKQVILARPEPHFSVGRELISPQCKHSHILLEKPPEINQSLQSDVRPLSADVITSSGSSWRRPVIGSMCEAADVGRAAVPAPARGGTHFKGRRRRPPVRALPRPAVLRVAPPRRQTRALRHGRVGNVASAGRAPHSSPDGQCARNGTRRGRRTGRTPVRLCHACADRPSDPDLSYPETAAVKRPSKRNLKSSSVQSSYRGLVTVTPKMCCN